MVAKSTPPKINTILQDLILRLLQFLKLRLILLESETANRRLEADSGEAGSEKLDGVRMHDWP
jgi:hypothetical protein